MNLPRTPIAIGGAAAAGLLSGAIAAVAITRSRDTTSDVAAVLQPLFDQAHARMHTNEANRTPPAKAAAKAARRLVLLGLAAAGGYAGARAMLERDDPPEGLPGPLQGIAEKAHSGLHRAEGIATEALDEARIERAAAEAELTAEYHNRRAAQS